MKISTFLEVLWAATLTHRVRSRFASRGGLFLVSPPGQLKTSLLSCFEDYYGVLGYSDLTTTSLVQARDLIASNKAHTIVLYDLQKLYERRPDTAANIEGNLRSIMDEGFTTANYENVSKNAITSKARALVMAACTNRFYQNKLASWEVTGMARRVMFCVYKLRRPEKIQQAIMQDRPIELVMNGVSVPVNLEISGEISKTDENLLRKIMQRQPEDVPMILMRKILCVLKWKYKRMRKPDSSHRILTEFSECLKSEAEVEL
jgi:hypothetical protein